MNTAPEKMVRSRGTRKPQQHSSSNLIFAKKEKIRRLSSVNGTQQSKPETGTFCCCDLSSDNRENQCPSHPHLSSPLISKSTAKRFQIPRKISDACPVVDHASVPRKLRSAMKKHGDEAVPTHSPDSKKPKLNLEQAGSDRSTKATVSMSITKDEEEVVEILYALAGMFPGEDSLGLRSSVQPDTAESLVTLLEVKTEDKSSAQAANIVPLFTDDESSNKADKLNSMNETSTREQPDLPERKKMLHFKPDSTISEIRTNSDIPFFKSEPDAEKSCMHGDRGPRVGHTIRELGKNGLALWPGLSSLVPLAPQSHSSSQSVANTIPTWLDAANYDPQTRSLETGSSTGKVLKIIGDKNTVKKSATHVYISRLIHSLQMQDNKDGILQQTLWSKPRVGSKKKALWYPNNCSNLRNAINGNVPGSTFGNTATDRNSYEARSGIIPPKKMLQQEQPRTASASGMNTSQGQSFDFLSLSPWGVGIDGNNNYSEDCNTMRSMSQLQVSRFHSHPQHQSLIPFSISPTDYTSSACMDHLSTATATAQVHLQLPQYLSNPFCDPPHISHSGVKKEQQRQQFWAAHQAAQYRPHGNSASMPCAQTAIAPHPSLDAFGPKYYSVSQYQQPKIAYASSFPPTRVKRTDHHFSSVYEESNAGFSSDRPLSLQLLRN